MMYAFFALAAQSPGRQLAFRRAVAAHVCLLGGCVWVLQHMPLAGAAPLLGNVLLVAGIVEGALLIGWRLTQLPRSQALEFLLVSPLEPWRVFLAEALVGVGRLTLVTLAGLPLLALVSLGGWVAPLDVLVLLAMPVTWGTVAGLGLTVWAYEAQGVRRWGERAALVMVVAYLVIGVLAGEQLRGWLTVLPDGLGQAAYQVFAAGHEYNPFSVVAYWMTREPDDAWQRLAGLQLGAVVLAGVLLARAAARLKGHFHERHYQPALDRSRGGRRAVGDRPLSWWAVKRVTQYSGRINLWLAGGFGVLYALYIVAGPAWPSWLGRCVFQLCDTMGGVPMLTACLVLLAAVPAAFQYGLWDSSAQDRCRRLELLLLTELDAKDYWNAAAAAAWHRGRGYLAVAGLLGGAAVWAGRASAGQMAAALAAGALLWGLYFALGFRAFARGRQANGEGVLLTLGLPLAAVLLFQIDLGPLASLFPPASVYLLGSGPTELAVLPGILLTSCAALAAARRGQADCDRQLRRWYEAHHGRKVLD